MKNVPKVEFVATMPNGAVLPDIPDDELVRHLAVAMLDRGKWGDIEAIVDSLPHDSPIIAALQRCNWALPKGSWYMPEPDGVKAGRMMKPMIGYADFHRKLAQKNPFLRATLDNQLAVRGWQHKPSGFRVSLTVDQTEQYGALVHVSMSYATQDPTWDEIKQVRSVFYPPFIDAMMVLPKSSDYVNVHSHCFHLYQMPTTWGLL